MSKSYEYRLVEAHRVVTALHMAGFAGAVVAGGYLRDSRLGLDPKDMDVFIPHCAQRDNDILAFNLQAALGMEVNLQFNISEYANLEVCRIFEATPEPHWTSHDAVPIQVIELNRGLAPQGRELDFGLCQVWMGHDGAVHSTPAYEQDIREKTFTLLKAETEDEHRRSLRRWERLKVKLEPLGFRFVDRSPFSDEVVL